MGLCNSSYSFLILGLEESGKTTIVENLRSPKRKIISTAQPPTIGNNAVAFYDSEFKHVSIWEMGGNKKSRALWSTLLPRAQGLIWVIDISKPALFQESFSLLERMLMEVQVDTKVRIMAGKPVYIVLNKTDLIKEHPIETKVASISYINEAWEILWNKNPSEIPNPMKVDTHCAIDLPFLLRPILRFMIGEIRNSETPLILRLLTGDVAHVPSTETVRSSASEHNQNLKEEKKIGASAEPSQLTNSKMEEIPLGT